MIEVIVTSLLLATAVGCIGAYGYLWHLFLKSARDVQLSILAYHLLCFIWLACYWLPVWLIANTEFYGNWFHVCQSAVPAFLIFATAFLIKPSWRKALEMVLLLQIFHNLADVVLDDAWQSYDLRQAVLNGMELAILAGFGLPYLIYTTHKAYRATRSADSGPSIRRGMAKGGQGLSGSA